MLPHALPLRASPCLADTRHWEEEDPGTILLDEERFTGDLRAQLEPEYEFDQRVNW